MWARAVCKSKKRELLITLYCFRLFVLWVPLYEERKHNVTKPEDILTDTPTCKSEMYMYIFNIALVIIENVRFAFLYVLSICV